MENLNSQKIHEIEISRINIFNPRVRSKKVFAEIVENIKQVGLKRPITISPSKSKSSNKDYDLVCGQGRIEAFLQLYNLVRVVFPQLLSMKLRKRFYSKASLKIWPAAYTSLWII